MSTETGVRGHTRQWSCKLRPEPIRPEDRDGQETEPLSPAPLPYHIDQDGDKRRTRALSKLWVANAPWSVKKDGISATVEFVRALIGYILYAPCRIDNNRAWQLTI